EPIPRGRCRARTAMCRRRSGSVGEVRPRVPAGALSRRRRARSARRRARDRRRALRRALRDEGWRRRAAVAVPLLRRQEQPRQLAARGAGAALRRSCSGAAPARAAGGRRSRRGAGAGGSAAGPPSRAGARRARPRARPARRQGSAAPRLLLPAGADARRGRTAARRARSHRLAAADADAACDPRRHRARAARSARVDRRADRRVHLVDRGGSRSARSRSAARRRHAAPRGLGAIAMTNAIDKLLREALARERGITPQTPCLDADTAAALAEGTLASRDRAAAEAHIAGCARCQAMIAALARTLPPVSAPVWWRRPAFVWLAPLTAVAAALVVWAAVPQRERPSPRARPSTAAQPAEIEQSGAAAARKEEAREPQQPPQLARSEAAPLTAPPPPAVVKGGRAASRAPAANDQRASSARKEADAMRERTFADGTAASAIAPPPAPAPAIGGELQASVGRAAPAPPPAPPLQSKPLPTAAARAGAAGADAAAPQVVTESVL